METIFVPGSLAATRIKKLGVYKSFKLTKYGLEINGIQFVFQYQNNKALHVCAVIVANHPETRISDRLN